MALPKTGTFGYETYGYDYYWESLAFPTLTHPVSGRAINPRVSLANRPKESAVLKWRLANGYQKTRTIEDARPDVYLVEYKLLPQSVWEELIAFERTYANFGEGAFNWTNPTDSVVKSVKFLTTIQSRLHEAEGSLWDVSFELEEQV